MPVGNRIAVVVLAIACLGCTGTDASERRAARTRTARSSAPASTTTAVTLLPSTTAVVASSPTTGPPVPQFHFAAVPISGTARQRVVGSSWRPGCPVPLEQLRYVTVSYWDFGGTARDGELIVNADAVDGIVTAFHRLFNARFPLRSMRLVDDFGADDFMSIEADNTSAFNCRERSTGGGVWSQHAYGRAIDVNPIENPYVTNGSTSHTASRPYLSRSNVRPGMAVAGGTLVGAFAAVGWGWGGRWSSPTDYQHFSSTGN